MAENRLPLTAAKADPFAKAHPAKRLEAILHS
jgi:hypothetical protein